MSYKSKTWVDRISDKPTRRTLTIESQTDSSIICTVQRSEGTVSKEGDAFNAANMNDLEKRIANGLDEKLDGQKLETDADVILSKTSADGSAPDCYAIKLIYDKLKKSVADGKTLLANAISAQGTTASSDSDFSTLAAAVTTACNTRYSAGYNTGYEKGVDDGESAGGESGYNTGYAAGKSDGITYADGRVNTSSASYAAGLAAGKTAASAKVTATITNVQAWDSSEYNVRATLNADATATLANGKLTIALNGAAGAIETNNHKYADAKRSVSNSATVD